MVVQCQIQRFLILLHSCFKTSAELVNRERGKHVALKHLAGAAHPDCDFKGV